MCGLNYIIKKCKNSVLDTLEIKKFLGEHAHKPL